MSAETIVRWIDAAIVLVIFYRVVISPFIAKALELKTEKTIEEKKRISFDENELELTDNSDALHRRVEQSLKLSEADRIERLKHDVLRDKLRKITEDTPRESSRAILELLKGEKA